jgi:hypothetical protein
MTAVDRATPEQIREAIQMVQNNPATYSKVGLSVAWELANAPDHRRSRSELEAKFGDVLDLHFGWFSRRVAEALGDPDPPAFALADKRDDDALGGLFVLKNNVVKALKPRS